MPTCSHPKCERKIAPDNVAKCCARHQHSAYCKCVRCTKHRARPRAERRTTRTDLATVMVPRPGAYQGDVIYDPVTMPIPPWEKGVTPC
jgi:hypothetical protein